MKPGPTTVNPDDIRTLISSSDQQGSNSPTQDIQEIAKLHEAKWPQAKRDEHKAKGGFFAGPGTSFPLKDGEDVDHAAGLHGHADNPSKVKSNIIKFAKDHNLTAYLPKAWKEADAQVQEGHSEIRQLCRIVEAQTLNPDGHEVRVTILQGGKSANGYSYDQMALQSIAQMIEGAQAYADHGAPDVTTRSVRDIVGFYHNAAYIPGQPGRVEANLHIMES